MEKAGLIKCLDFLKERDKVVKELVTDRHPAIQKYMRLENPQVIHSYDVWHIAKGVFSLYVINGVEKK